MTFSDLNTLIYFPASSKCPLYQEKRGGVALTDLGSSPGLAPAPALSKTVFFSVIGGNRDPTTCRFF